MISSRISRTESFDMEEKVMISANEAINRLKEGNKKYLTEKTGSGDISPAVRLRTFQNGQQPYAIVIACSDSRVIPESICCAGIGELFTIRLACNVIDDHQLGSIEYAASHLDCGQIIVLGHTGCGAVDAALKGHSDGFIRFIIEDIQEAIGAEKDPSQACRLNVLHAMERLKEEFALHPEIAGIDISGGIYDISSGKVEWIN